MLQSWDANFEFNQRSPDKLIESIYASVIEAALTKKMKESDYLLIIIGEKSLEKIVIALNNTESKI